jgi:hypothetical protein
MGSSQISSHAVELLLLCAVATAVTRLDAAQAAQCMLHHQIMHIT